MRFGAPLPQPVLKVTLVVDVEIFVDSAAPVRCTKPVPVPLHFREQVKKDLLADEQRGVIEKVPLGVTPTWEA